MKTSESIGNIAKALSQFQSAVKQPKKTAVNPHFKSKYVPLDNVVESINIVAPSFGLSYIQVPVNDEGGIGVSTIIMHESGEYIEFPAFILPLDKKTAQGVGSALTYARRYSLSAAFGIASDEDDDGNGVEQSAPQRKTSPQPQKRPSNPSDDMMNTIYTLVNIVAEKASKTPEEVSAGFRVQDIKTHDQAAVVAEKLRKQIDKLEEKK